LFFEKAQNAFNIKEVIVLILPFQKEFPDQAATSKEKNCCSIRTKGETFRALLTNVKLGWSNFFSSNQ
jgi:hypothetical protein